MSKQIKATAKPTGKAPRAAAKPTSKGLTKAQIAALRKQARKLDINASVQALAGITGKQAEMDETIGNALVVAFAARDLHNLPNFGKRENSKGVFTAVQIDSKAVPEDYRKVWDWVFADLAKVVNREVIPADIGTSADDKAWQMAMQTRRNIFTSIVAFIRGECSHIRSTITEAKKAAKAAIEGDGGRKAGSKRDIKTRAREELRKLRDAIKAAEDTMGTDVILPLLDAALAKLG